MWVSSLKWIRAGSKDVESCIRSAARRLPIRVLDLIWRRCWEVPPSLLFFCFLSFPPSWVQVAYLSALFPNALRLCHSPQKINYGTGKTGSSTMHHEGRGINCRRQLYSIMWHRTVCRPSWGSKTIHGRNHQLIYPCMDRLVVQSFHMETWPLWGPVMWALWFSLGSFPGQCLNHASYTQFNACCSLCLLRGPEDRRSTFFWSDCGLL
jgi:hypothetical protein